jgi:hypothetical protein
LKKFICKYNFVIVKNLLMKDLMRVWLTLLSGSHSTSSFSKIQSDITALSC